MYNSPKFYLSTRFVLCRYCGGSLWVNFTGTYDCQGTLNNKLSKDFYTQIDIQYVFGPYSHIWTDLLHKFYNAPLLYPTIHHFVT